MSKYDYNPGPTISHAAGINIGTPDLEKSLWFFRDLLGMEVTAQTENVAYLRGYQEHVHHSLTLTRQANSAVNSLSFRVGRREDVELFHDRIQKSETDVLELPSGSEAGRGEAIRFLIPGSNHPVELYYDIDRTAGDPDLKSQLLGNSTRRRGLGVQRIDHLNVSTTPSTIGTAERWMREELGMKRREYAAAEPGTDDLWVSWLSVNSRLHDIAIAANEQEGDARFHHVAFHLANYHDVLTAADVLRDNGIQIDAGPGVHGVGQAMYLYVRDPGSGHRIELYSGGYPFFEPDWEATYWGIAEMGAGMTWVADLPNMDPATSTYVTTTAMSGLEFNRAGGQA
ncbi:VOC family protein [Microbacterium sp. NC79]|uniref:VOC family protein n=1 Tax=Microbacterium sp. NC79 TaxID=2851009 RepID=UPI001C2C2DF2|nr:VOC family protein [Microbacterium sp. NC79]MBV0895527.1 VOC family protein [Microbacterium sp. NC79]